MNSLRNVKKWLHGARNRARSFGQDNAGIAALEFAYMLPLLLAVIFGSAAAFDYYQVQKRGSLAADTLADLTARSIQMDDATGTAVFAAGNLIMGKYANQIQLDAEILAYKFDDANSEFVLDWRFKTGVGYIAPSGETKPAGTFPTLSNGEMVIHSIIDFSYASPMTFLDSAALTFHQEAVRSPRYAVSIPYFP